MRQAIVHIPRKGGCKSSKRICAQLRYLDQDEDVVLEMSERHGGARMTRDEYEDWATQWAEQTGHYHNGESLYDGEQDLTTHIIVSFPPGTDAGAAYAAGREWAEELFGSGRNGGEWDYITGFHTNRPHPHLHVIVNRRSLAARGEWLAISHRNRFINYDSMRSVLVDAALRHDIRLDASSREQRGLQGRGPTTAEYRRQARVGFHNEFAEHTEVVDLARDGQHEVFPELTGRRPIAGHGGAPSDAAGGSGSEIDDERQDRRRASLSEDDEPDLYGIEDVDDHPDFDALAAHQLHEEMAAAEMAELLRDPDIPNHELFANLQRLAVHQAQNSAPDGGAIKREQDHPSYPSGAGGVSSGYAASTAHNSEIDDQIRREMEQHHARQIAQSRRDRERDDLTAGPSRRRTPGVTAQGAPPADISSAAQNSEIDDQIRQEMEEYHARQTARSRRTRAIDDVAIGPGRRRTPAGSAKTDDEDTVSAPAGAAPPHASEPLETRGERIRRRSAERAAERERQRAFAAQGEGPGGTQADTPTADSASFSDAPSAVTQHQASNAGRSKRKREAAVAEPSQSAAGPVATPAAAVPSERGPEGASQGHRPAQTSERSPNRDRGRTR